ncbi:hypothetical protein [Xanthomonas sp. XNM01]|nr:hypothetical protein [Xanthomonas sp. XNM01]
MHTQQSQEARSMMVDIDREKAYWRVHYGGLPKASAVRSFVRYWP